jgi:hypothetical protein
MASLAITTIAAVADAIVTGHWFGGLLYVAFVAGSLGQWATIRRESDDAKSAADRMLIGVCFLLAWIARPALYTLETLVFG